MDIYSLIKQHRETLSREWFKAVISSYPEETAKFLRSQKDQFANPVGHTIKKELDAILAQLGEGITTGDAVDGFLDRIIRIRALQDYTPSDAVVFIFQLKDIIRQQLFRQIAEHELADQLVELEAGIDRLALSAFDIYAACRQKVFEIRVEESKRLIANLLKRSDMFYEMPDVQSEPDIS